MSVLIKGMDMPSLYKTYKVRFAETDGGKIVVGIANEDSIEYTPAGEAVFLPPHGRLIDADALLDDLLFPSKQFEQGMRELIGDAPTVIPAEEGE